MVPFNERFPAIKPGGPIATVPEPNSNLPALRSANPLVKTGGLGSILDMLRPLIASGVAKQGAKSLIGGPLMTGLNAAAMVMKPTTMGAEAPIYVRDAQGKLVPNMANPIVAGMVHNGPGSQMTQPAPQALSVPLPQPRPQMVPMPQPRPPMAGMNVPLPRPRPQVPDPTSYYYGPGSQNFGAEGPSGNTYGQSPGLLSALFGK